MCGSPSDPVAQPLGDNVCWKFDCRLTEEIEERVAGHIVHVEQQDDVRKRVQHPKTYSIECYMEEEVAGIAQSV